jgi:dihydrofolate synthase / folylpolyglutamate synthase
VSSPGRPLTASEAEAYLLSLELFGMRFGLDRMRRLTTVLGSPQASFGSVHVVGSNGKSSTARLTAAILRRHGLRTGTYLSPHLVAFTERVRVDDADVTPEAFAAAVERARTAAAKVDRTLEGDDHVTQFEALTAAAFDLLARAGVDVAIVEAGLGGRFDATNVIPSSVTVLTNVGLEHTRWLGPTITDIAREKVDVLRPGSALVLGRWLHPDARAVADAVAAERGARLIVAQPAPDVALLARGTFQRENFALARAAAEAYRGAALEPEAVRAAAASTLVPGRFQRLDPDPGSAPAGPTAEVIIDGAHNPAGMAALADSLRAELAGRPLVAVVSVLDDKDAAAMLRELLPLCSAVICTGNASPRALSPGTLRSLAGQVGSLPEDRVLLERDPKRALERARELAGPDGVALATGSLYLLADLLRPATARRASAL